MCQRGWRGDFLILLKIRIVHDFIKSNPNFPLKEENCNKDLKMEETIQSDYNIHIETSKILGQDF